MQAAAKALLYLSTLSLLGAGVFQLFIADKALLRRWIMVTGAVAGGFLLIALSFLEVALILQRLLGYLEGEIFLDYLQTTQHGTSILWRSALAVTVTLSVILTWRFLAGWQLRLARLIFLLLSFALLFSFSRVSHAAAMGGVGPLLSDLVHFSAAGAWGGAIFYLALSPAWQQATQHSALVSSLQRVSSLGLISVALIFSTGIFNTLIHLHSPAEFIRSAYGYALYAKVTVVLIIVMIAAANRLLLFPSFQRNRHTARFKHLIRLEALLLIVVFALTGLLTTSPLPHDPTAQGTALENLIRLWHPTKGN